MQREHAVIIAKAALLIAELGTLNRMEATAKFTYWELNERRLQGIVNEVRQKLKFYIGELKKVGNDTTRKSLEQALDAIEKASDKIKPLKKLYQIGLGPGGRDARRAG